MFIGHFKVSIFIPHSRSLKDRRQVVERLKSRLRNNFNISVAEEPSDKWQMCGLSFVCIDHTRDFVNVTIDRIEDFIRLDNSINITEAEKEIF